MIFPKFVNTRVVSFYLHVAGLLSLVSWRPSPPSTWLLGGDRARELSREDRRAVGPKRRQRLGANRMLFVICNVY